MTGKHRPAVAAVKRANRSKARRPSPSIEQHQREPRNAREFLPHPVVPQPVTVEDIPEEEDEIEDEVYLSDSWKPPEGQEEEEEDEFIEEEVEEEEGSDYFLELDHPPDQFVSPTLATRLKEVRLSTILIHTQSTNPTAQA